MIQKNSLVAETWRAQVHWVDQAWRVAEKFFAEFFGFLFDNMFWCYLVFVSIFPAL